jgi:zinc protease
MSRRTALLLFILLAAPSAVAAERHELPNGLTVILSPRRTAPVVTVAAFLRAGRIYEPEEKAGLSHFAEHMMFRATGRRPEGGAEREVWSVGGSLSAFTHHDYTEYLVTVPSEHRTLAMDILSDFLLSAAFQPEEVEEERRVVLDEIRRRAATPQTHAFEALSGLSFLPHPYGARIAGSVRTVADITREELVAYVRGHYRPERTFLVVVGDFDRKAILAEIRNAFYAWTRAAKPPPAPPSPGEALGHYQEVVVRREGTGPMVLASVALPGYLHPDYLPSRFLRPVLSGWLVQRLVNEERLALTADVFYSQTEHRNQLSLRLPLVRAEDAAKTRNALLDLLAMLRDPDFEFTSLAETAANFRAREILVNEDFHALARLIGQAAISGYYTEEGRPEHLAAEDCYHRVTQQDLHRVAGAYLQPQNLRVMFLLPPGSAAPAPPAALPPADASARFAPAPEPDRIPLEAVDAAVAAARPPLDSDAVRLDVGSGVTLLHLEREGVAVVGGAVLLPAGSRHDPPGREGLAALTMRALSLETRDSPGIRWRLFAYGYRSRFDVGRDVAAVTFTVPRGDLRECLHTVAEILDRPSLSDGAIEEARGALLREAESTAERVHLFGGARVRAAVLHGEDYDRYDQEPHGTPETLRAITPENVRAFYRDHYRRDTELRPFVIAVVGDVSRRVATANVLEAFSRSGEGPSISHGGNRPRLAWPGPVREVRASHPSGRAYVALGTRAPALGAPFYEEVSLLRLALGWRVFHEFTDVRSTAYQAGSFYSSLALGGAFALYVETSPDRVPETRDVLEGILREAVESGLSEDLVADAKGSWLGGASLSRMRASNVAFRLAFRELAGLGHGSFEDGVGRIPEIGAGDLKAVCGRLFPGGRGLTLLVNGPSSGRNRESGEGVSAPRVR